MSLYRAIGCRRRCDNTTGVGIDNDVQLSPCAALGALTPETLPLWTRKPVQSQGVKRSGVGRNGDRYVESFGAPRQSSVIGDAEA